MRIAIITSSARLAGGVERFVEHAASVLLARGHELSLWYETDEPSSRPRLALGTSVEAHELHRSSAAGRISAWHPDVLFAHGIDDRHLEHALLTSRPSVFVVQNYDGACVSGTKTWAVEPLRPCNRILDAGCLLHYYPHRCGGLSPLTALRLYRRATLRRDTLVACSRIIVMSEHMRRECTRHGLDPARVIVVPPVADAVSSRERSPFGRATRPLRLVFLGRLEAGKGVFLLLRSMPLAADALGQPLSLTIAGDGRDLGRLREAAARYGADGRVEIRFTGWLDGDARDRLFDHSDLFVFPSVWPEPFGLSGLEAASRGLPAVAFDTGGVREWLRPGATGLLAPGDPPTAEGLAAAIIGCLQDPTRTRQMGAAARRLAAEFTAERHAAALEGVLCAAAGQPVQPARTHAAAVGH